MLLALRDPINNLLSLGQRYDLLRIEVETSRWLLDSTHLSYAHNAPLEV